MQCSANSIYFVLLRKNLFHDIVFCFIKIFSIFFWIYYDPLDLLDIFFFYFFWILLKETRVTTKHKNSLKSPKLEIKSSIREAIGSLNVCGQQHQNQLNPQPQPKPRYQPRHSNSHGPSSCQLPHYTQYAGLPRKRFVSGETSLFTTKTQNKFHSWFFFFKLYKIFNLLFDWVQSNGTNTQTEKPILPKGQFSEKKSLPKALKKSAPVTGRTFYIEYRPSATNDNLRFSFGIYVVFCKEPRTSGNQSLDGAGPVDNRPSTDQLHHFFQFFLLKKNVINIFFLCDR